MSKVPPAIRRSKRTKSQAGASARLKGSAGEREVVQILRLHGWPLAARSSDGRVQSQRGDVIGGPEGTHVEIKRSERLNICAALDQAIADASPMDVPVVVHRPSRHEWMATLPLADLLPLLKLKERG